ncbi:nuclease domain-containing protein, putative [Pediculus humanus corporis]|uniref:Staphylococcal nuclease domain-containing protein 1 n=1 Tax=Pediculus humanus subsp. corporis TaxID=121224 RepID=E0V9W1_PEDHC|nr:nuclease domain-containing protein, putative [Pediculus humanus corporis]EEB10167.1 nuclease domain-containing protein, putative [Pediculus humanus corporis]
MSTPQPQPPKKWVVKQILSGDSVLLREEPKGGPPPERQIVFSNIVAPKLARPGRGAGKDNVEETKDEPFAWETREFLRKKLIGQEVTVTIDKNPSGSTGTRDYGFLQLGKENITHSLISEGLVSVRDAVGNSKEGAELKALEAAAKAAKKGKWDPNADPQKHVRDMKWSIDNMRGYLDKHHKKRIPAIIEHVRDGSTVKALLLPDFCTVTIMLTGIRCPSIKYDSNGQIDPSTPDLLLAQEAKFFVEKHLLQRDVEVILESTSNNNFVGTVLVPKRNIAEGLLKEGYAHCVDWSMAFLTFGADKLRAAERYAKENRIRRWKDFQPKTPLLSGKEKEFSGTVVEVINGDALMVKVGNAPPRKIFLSSIRPPREAANKAADENKPPAHKTKVVRPLYDIPWMFEAREFLRKKLIGKKVNVIVDYKQPAVENFPEKTCCTVMIGGTNVAEALISKGFGTVVRYRQNDDQRSSRYDDLLAAEAKASKASRGVFAKKDIPQHRVNDLSADPARAKQFLSSLQRSINCPRGSRPGAKTNNQQAPSMVPGEPYGEEALQFTKEKCMQKEVEIQVEYIDKVRGNFIGWLWIDGVNLSVALVEEGLASVHGSAEKSEHYRALKMAEDAAKARKEKIWKDYVEEVEKEEKPEDEPMTERKIDYQTVVVVEATSDLRFYAQMVDQGPRLEVLMNQIRQEFQTNPPLPGAYTPKKGDICAAKFEDDQWYRAKVEKVTNKEVQIFYIDYGNKESTTPARCANLPSNFTTEKPFAHEFGLAFVKLPLDVEYQEEAVKAFKEDVEGKTLLLNVEYKIQKLAYATLTCPKTKVDIAKELITDGLLLLDSRREKRLQKVVSEYRSAQEEAKKDHRFIWQYGDITEDDAKEFGR